MSADQVDLVKCAIRRHDALFGVIGLGNQFAPRGRNEGRSPKLEAAFDPHAVGGAQPDAVGDRMTTHCRQPGVLLADTELLLFLVDPTNRGRIKQHFRALQHHAASGFREPLVPADRNADTCVLGLPCAKTGVARAEVELFLVAG